MTGGAQDSGVLLPCPVCGEHPRWRGSRHDYAAGLYRLQCLGETHLFQSYGPSEAKAIENWNTRTTPAPAGWQPIESAPKDDTLILVWRQTTYSDDPFVVVRWEDDWWQVHDGKNDWALRGPDPTHWMPLPKSPEHS